MSSRKTWGSRPRKSNESFTVLLEEVIYLDLNLASSKKLVITFKLTTTQNRIIRGKHKNKTI